MILHFAASILNLAVFFAASCVVFLFLARVLRFSEEEALRNFVLSLGFGPLLISWLLKYLMHFVPARSDTFYISAVSLVFGVLAIVGWRRRNLLALLGRRLLDFLGTWRLKRHWPALVPLAITLGATLIVVLTCLLLPLRENDPLEYAKIAQLIYDYRTTDVYPFLEADAETGYYMPLTHPLGFPMLMVWSYLLQGSHEYTYLLRTIAPFYTLCSLAALWVFAGHRSRFCGPAAMLLFVSVPFVTLMTLAHHVDPIRIYFFFMTFVSATHLIGSGRWRDSVLTGLLAGASMYTHSIGVLALVFLFPIYGLLARQPIFRRAAHLAVICGIALLMCGDRYWTNYRQFGSPISNSMPVWEIEEIDYASHVALARNLRTPVERVVFGYFKGFSKPQSFGYSYWFFLGGALLAARAARDSYEKVLLTVVACFYGVLLVMLLGDMPSAIMNDRYQLTVQPMIAYVGTVPLRWWYASN